jgi:hypothetical protein
MIFPCLSGPLVEPLSHTSEFAGWGIFNAREFVQAADAPIVELPVIEVSSSDFLKTMCFTPIMK